jgi:hypothetical protein
MADPLVLDARTVAAQIERLKLDFPDMLADAELLAGMVEGETDFDRIIERVVDRILDADSMVDAITIRAKNLAERKARYERRSHGYRSVVLGLMKAAGLKKKQLPEVTLSIPKQSTRVVVYDVDALPQGSYAMERVPAAAAALRAMIEADPKFPGARIDTSPETLVVRPK